MLGFSGLYAAGVGAVAVAAIGHRRSQTWTLLAFCILAVVAVAATVLTGKRHDYFYYVAQWSHTRAGGDPWAQNLEGIAENPGYGPLFNVFAPLAAAYELLPKLLFTGIWLSTTIALMRLFAVSERFRVLTPFLLAYFVLNPYFWIEIPLYGHFDILPAAAALGAVHLVVRGSGRSSGATLAVGTLLKIIPLTALPFLIAAARKLSLRIILGFASVVVVVQAFAYALWGTRALTYPLLATERNPKLLSIFAFLEGDYSPLRLVVERPNVGWMSLPLLTIAGTMLVWGLAIRHAHLVIAVLITFIVVLGLYVRGHPQFQMLVFVLVPYLFLTLGESVRRERLLWAMLGAYLAWISAFDVVYVLGGQLRESPWVELRDLVGLPAFLIAVATVFVLLRFRNAPLCVPASTQKGPRDGLHACGR